MIAAAHPCGGSTVRRAPRNSPVRTDSTQRRELIGGGGGALPRELRATLNPGRCRSALSLHRGMKKRRDESARGVSERRRICSGSKRKKKKKTSHTPPARAAPTVKFSWTHHTLIAARACLAINRRKSLRRVLCRRDAPRELWKPNCTRNVSALLKRRPETHIKIYTCINE